MSRLSDSFIRGLSVTVCGWLAADFGRTGAYGWMVACIALAAYWLVREWRS